MSFELVTKEDIVDYANESVIYKAETSIGKYNLKSDGTLTISNLPMGKYYIKELTTIDGAILDEIEHEVVFEQIDTTTKIYNVDLNIENDTTFLEVSKKEITGSDELEGAKLSIIDLNGNVLDSWISSKEPHKIEGLKLNETYILREDVAPLGYDKASEIQFQLENKEEKIEMVDMLILKNIKVIKVDNQTKEVIKENFAFGIYENPECTKLIKEVKSNKEDGTALFEELRYGTYYIKEIKAPTDYELSDRVVKVDINDTGIFVNDEQVEETDSTIEFTFGNKKIEVPKTGDESKSKLFAGAVILSLLGIIYIVIRNHKKNKGN